MSNNTTRENKKSGNKRAWQKETKFSYPSFRKRIHLCRTVLLPSSIPPSLSPLSLFLFPVISSLPLPSIDLTEGSPEFSWGSSPAVELFSRENFDRTYSKTTAFASQNELFSSSHFGGGRGRGGVPSVTRKKIATGNAVICFGDSVEAP